MGRPGLTRHRKFLRLARALDGVQVGFGELLARGALEWVWDSAYENGEPLLGDADDVEGAARWRGDRGLLCEALRFAGFIEDAPNESGQFQVHDLFDHAPEYVQRRAEREAERVAKGKTISDLRRDAANARWTREKQAAAGCSSGAPACNANGATPAPAPAPAPAPHPENLSLVAEGEGGQKRPEDEVLDLWNVAAGRAGLPRSRGSEKVRATIRTRLKTSGWRDALVAALSYVEASPWHRGENDRQWTASLEWLLRPGKAEELADKAVTSLPRGRTGAVQSLPTLNGREDLG